MSKVFFVIYCSQSQGAFAICIAREILCFKSYLLWDPQCICLGSYKACSKKFLCWGRPHPESQKLAVEKDAHHLLSLYTCNFFRSYALAAAVPGLQTDPILILLGAKESTTVRSHKSCLSAAHGTSVKPCGRF